jgi:hypothetical protein
MHEKPSDKRAHGLPYRFFPSAMHLDEIGSIGHRAFGLPGSMREFFYGLIFAAITSL